MKELLRKAYYSVLKHLPKKMVINMENIFAYKKNVSKKNPKYFGEKIQWLKLYGHLEQYSDYVDKYKVRKYVKETIGEEYLIPLLGAYDRVEDIDYSKLPESFVLKLNNGSGCNLIVKDKSNLDIEKTNKILKKWLKLDYSKIKKEDQYKNVKNMILCEKYITDKNGELLDYKYFCFNGEPELVKVDFDRFTEHKANYYNLDWELQEIKECRVGGMYENYRGAFKPPKNYAEMLTIVKKLCRDFSFVRVDIYNVDGKIYFGELTLTPASGRNPLYPIEKDVEIAAKMEIGHE